MHAIQSQLLQAFGAIFGKGHTILLLYSGRTQLHFYPGASERSHQKDLLEQLNTRIERGGQRVQRAVILRSRTRFLEEQKSMASRQRTNTSPTNCTIVSAGSPTAVRVALAGDTARTGMPTGTKGHACDLPILARPVRRRAAAMRLLLRRLRPDMLRAHHGTVSKLTVLANSSF